MLKTKRKNLTSYISPILVFILLYLLLEIIVRVFNIPAFILPSPTRILSKFFANFFGILIPNMLVTLQEIILGFIIGVPIGIVLAAFMTQYKIIDKALSPYVILLVTTPLLTLTPLLMVWLGFGMNVKIIAVVIQTFPIVMMNSATGFNNVSELKLELMKSMGASRAQKFFRVILPDALPDVFTGIKLGGIFATTTAISTEFVGGNEGIGNLITTATSWIKTDEAFAYIIGASIIGISLYGLISWIESRVIKWQI